MESQYMYYKCKEVLSRTNEIVTDKYKNHGEGTLYVPICVDLSAGSFTMRADMVSSLEQEKYNLRHLLTMCDRQQCDEKASFLSPSLPSLSSSSSAPAAAASASVLLAMEGEEAQEGGGTSTGRSIRRKSQPKTYYNQDLRKFSTISKRRYCLKNQIDRLNIIKSLFVKDKVPSNKLLCPFDEYGVLDMLQSCMLVDIERRNFLTIPQVSILTRVKMQEIGENIDHISRTDKEINNLLTNLFITIRHIALLLLSAKNKTQDHKTLHCLENQSFDSDTKERMQNTELTPAVCRNETYNHVDVVPFQMEATTIGQYYSPQRIYNEDQEGYTRGPGNVLLIDEIAHNVERLLEQKKRMNKKLSTALDSVNSMISMIAVGKFKFKDL